MQEYNENSIEINGIEYVRKSDLILRYPEAKDDMNFVIVRASAAGVHAGWLKKVDYNNKIAYLVGARRMFRWFARSLSGASLEGVDPTKCKFGDPIGTPDNPHIVADWCEIIPCTDEAQRAIAAVEIWEND